MKLAAIVLFVLTYVFLLAMPSRRAFIALGSGAVFVALGILPLNQVLGTIDWNVLLMIAGTMGIVALFIQSRMPSLLADMIIEKTPNVKWAIVALSLFAGIISAFVDNVATVLMVAPVAITIAKKLEMSPVNSIIAISVASNLQGAATLVGDTTSILLGGYAKMNFMDFFVYQGKPGLFWIVQLSAIASTFVLLYLFRKDNKVVEPMGRTKVTNFFPTYLLLGMIVLLIVSSFMSLDFLPEWMILNINGIICVTLMVIGMFHEYLRTQDRTVFRKTLMEVDFFTIMLLAGLFLVIGGITQAGVVDDISTIFIQFSKDNLFVIYTLVVWASVIFSAFIDNIPYVATMLPVVTSIAAQLGIDPTLLYFGLLSGATLGGNLTPIGASANITSLGILRKEGHVVSAKKFMSIGVPFTLAAVITGYVLIWILF